MTQSINETDTHRFSGQCLKAQAFSPIKHAGFSKTVFNWIGHFTRATFQFLRTKWHFHQDRRCLNRMTHLDNALLDDMNIKRADIYYILQTKSPLLPSERLKLLSLERRSIMRKDQERRKTYLENLVPAPFNGCIKNNKKPKTTA